MIKNITRFFIAACIILLNLSFFTYYNMRPFSVDSVKDNINFFSSKRFKGRLAGTIENQEACEIIKKDFEDTGLKSLNGNYYEPFIVNCPKMIQGKPCLNITDSSGSLIKEFKYNIDYKEDMLNFKKNSFKFNNNNKVIHVGNILEVIQNSSTFVFYVPQNNKIGFRSSFMDNSSASIYIQVTSHTLEDILNYLYNGFTINCSIPFSTQKNTIDNVVGYIKGKNSSKPPLILCAHFDHLGCDLAGNVYEGALDNASGISFVIEMSKYVKSLGQPDCDIFFIGFNAEEFGCLGSKNFVEKNQNYINGGKVFNFDMVGSRSSIPLSLMCSKNDSPNMPFLKAVSSDCSKKHIYFNYLFEDASDHEAFRRHGIDAITFCDDDKSKIHTLQDKPDYVDSYGIKRCFNVISGEVIKYGYNDNPMLICYKEFFYGSLISLTLLSLIYLSLKDKIR